jgi:hypothetical protein
LSSFLPRIEYGVNSSRNPESLDFTGLPFSPYPISFFYPSFRRKPESSLLIPAKKEFLDKLSKDAFNGHNIFKINTINPQKPPSPLGGEGQGEG